MRANSDTPAVATGTGRFPRWGVNAALYLALGLMSLGVLQFFGPFGQFYEAGRSESAIGAIEVRVDGLRGASVPSVYLDIPNESSDDKEGVAELSIMFATAAGSTDTFGYDHLAVARRPITPEQPFYEESGLECEAKQYRRVESGEWTAAEMVPETVSSAQNFLPYKHPLAEEDNKGSVTQYSGNGAYVYLSVKCPITGIDFKSETRTAKSVAIPAVVVRTANPATDLTASVYLGREPNDLITNSTRPPDQTTLSSYIWNTESRSVGTDAMMVSITNPQLQTSNDKSMFMWGLFAGISGAFFVAVVQEVVGRDRRSSRR